MADLGCEARLASTGAGEAVGRRGTGAHCGLPSFFSLPRWYCRFGYSYSVMFGGFVSALVDVVLQPDDLV